MIQCAGAINGSHVPILTPALNHTDYYNRKGWYSMLIQAVVDHNYMFRDICIGWPGSARHARVLSNSSLYSKATRRDIFVRKCILGTWYRYTLIPYWRLCLSSEPLANETLFTQFQPYLCSTFLQLPPV